MGNEMTDRPTDRLTPAPSPTFRERQIEFWRTEARQNYLLGFMDLARTCETNATEWEWRPVPCSES